MFTPDQIQEILDIIEFQSNYFIAGNISDKFLKKEDRNFLKELGIDFESQFKDFTPFQQAFYFGRLVSILGPLKSKEIDLNDFKKYLRRGQFHPLSDYEKKTLEYLEDKTFSHIKDLKETIKTTIVNKVREVELINREQYEKVIKDSVKRSVVERNTVTQIVSEIGTYTKDWSRDLGRIAETEMQNAYEYGKIASFNEEGEGEYYKHVYGGACKHCIRLYLKNGIGSEPILFSYNELLSNGTNIGRKVNDWKATIGPIHPFCFTRSLTPVYTSKGYKYIKDIRVGDLVLTHKGRFRPVSELVFTERHPKDYGKVFKITIQIDDKELSLQGITQNHPILINGQWSEVKNIKVGDFVSLLYDGCEDPNCNNSTLVYNNISSGAPRTRFCSRSCANTYTARVQWEGEKNRQIVGPKIKKWMDERYRSMSFEEKKNLTRNGRKALKKKYPLTNGVPYEFTSPESRVKANSTNGKKCSFIEKKLRYFLGKLNIEYLIDFKIERDKRDTLGRQRYYFPDIYIPSLNMILEADGENWHDKEIDRKRDKEIKEKIGADVFRFSETQIRNNGAEVFGEIQRLIKNHKGEYSFRNGIVTNVSYKEKKDNYSKVKLYNLTVEEDESYIVNGVVVHNCRCDLRRKHKRDVWDKESKTFVPERRGKSAGEIKISVGDKTFIV